ncbi:hypothetical protein CLAIMM_01551, partial [Cladophialophora immunda]
MSSTITTRYPCRLQPAVTASSMELCYTKQPTFVVAIMSPPLFCRLSAALAPWFCSLTVGSYLGTPFMWMVEGSSGYKCSIPPTVMAEGHQTTKASKESKVSTRQHKTAQSATISF